MKRQFNEYTDGRVVAPHEHEKNYVPSYEREGYSEDLVEVLPSTGFIPPKRNMQDTLWRSHKDLPPKTPWKKR